MDPVSLERFASQYIFLTFILLLKDWASRQRRRDYTVREAIVAHVDSAAYRILHTPHSGTWVTQFGFDPKSFALLHGHFASIYPPASDRGRRRMLGTEATLAATLMWLHTTAKIDTMACFFGVSYSTMSRTIGQGLRTLDQLFETVRDQRWMIAWPRREDIQRFAHMVQAKAPGLERVFGFVDGLKLRVQEPGDTNKQNAYYNGWRSGTYVSQVLVFTPDGRICWLNYNKPGAYHDSTVAGELYRKLRTRVPNGYRILADSAFHGSSDNDLAAKILRVPKQNSREYDQSQRSWYRVITTNRQAVEWGMRSVQSGFQRLKLPLPANDTARSLILRVIFRLHNFRVAEMKISQIRKVYHDPWVNGQRQGEEEDMAMVGVNNP